MKDFDILLWVYFLDTKSVMLIEYYNIQGNYGTAVITGVDYGMGVQTPPEW